VAEVVVKALDRDPARRYPDAGAFLAALQGIETEQARKTAEEKASAERSAIEANASRITTGRQVAGPDQRPVAEEKAQRVIEAAPETPPKRLSTLALVAIVLVGLIGLTWLLGKLFTYTPPATIAPTQPIPTTISPTKAWTVTIAPPTQTVTMTFTPTNTLTPTLGIGSAKISTIDGMELLYVPAGKFLMGSDKSVDPQAYDNELPQHTVYLDAFWIDQTLVTNAMFTLFIQAIGYRTDAEKAGWGYVYQNGTWSQVNGANWQDPQGSGAGIQKIENHPVVQVSWNDANAYCQWAGRRLPTEAEWEKAARGTDGRIYPWGNQAPDTTLANFNMNVGDTTQVGSYPSGASPYGALDMAGNVWEWVSDWYSNTYYQSSPSSNPGGPSSGDYRVLRGGSWGNSGWYVRAADRFGGSPVDGNGYIGFRCAASP
jgi:formylglycine-generating enzyme required for sulfatase activity